MFITIVAAIIIFGMLVILHEFGHLAAAKSVGIRVNQFALGMGPVIFRKQKGDTEYSIRALPLGGFVKLEGEDEDSFDDKSFNSKSIPARMMVLAAGSIMNLIFAILLIIILFFMNGFPTNEIQSVVEGNPAQLAGLRAGDEIVEIQGNEIKSWEDTVNAISKSTGDQISITIDRDGNVQTIVTDIVTDETGRRVIGIIPANEKAFFRSVTEGTKYAFMMIAIMLDFLVGIFKGQASTTDVVGPVGIFHLVGEAARMGIPYVMNFTAMISMNLAVINLLPFPALDGGRLLLLAVQGITGKKLNPEKEGFIHFIGFVILIGLMILVTFRDVERFIL